MATKKVSAKKAEVKEATKNVATTKTPTLKMTNVNKVLFAHEFTMKMRDNKIIYAIKKVVERELKISFAEWLYKHLESIDTVKSAFSELKKMITYKRNADIVKCVFDVEKIDSTWKKFVDKTVLELTSKAKENKVSSTNPKEEKNVRKITEAKTSTKKKVAKKKDNKENVVKEEVKEEVKEVEAEK